MGVRGWGVQLLSSGPDRSSLHPIGMATIYIPTVTIIAAVESAQEGYSTSALNLFHKVGRYSGQHPEATSEDVAADASEMILRTMYPTCNMTSVGMVRLITRLYWRNHNKEGK
jgi:hypothetical protein